MTNYQTQLHPFTSERYCNCIHEHIKELLRSRGEIHDENILDYPRAEA
jgi:hypothetical protein